MCIFSCDLGGTYTKWGIFKNDCLIENGQFKSNASKGGKALLDTLVKKIKEMQTCYEIKGIAISSAGTIDHISGMVVQASDIIPGYKGMNIIEYIQKHIALPISVDNDVNCAMYAEAVAGAAKEAKMVFGITLGTGVGSAIIINKEIYHGSKGFAGEIGYLTIGQEVLDLSGSTRGLAMRVATRKKEDHSLWDGKRVFEGYFNKDIICIEEIDALTENISEVLKMAICFLNPDMIVIGGGILAQKDILLPQIIQKTSNKVPFVISDNLKIKACEFENQAGIYGAYYLYKEKMNER